MVVRQSADFTTCESYSQRSNSSRYTGIFPSIRECGTVELMRGFRIYRHTEKVGVAEGRILRAQRGRRAGSVEEWSAEGGSAEVLLGCARQSAQFRTDS